MAAGHPPFFKNKLLSVLRDEGREDFLDRLTKVDLPRRAPIETRMKKTDHVFFLEEGIASIVATNDMQVEIGIIGNEGVTGVSIIHMVADATYSSYMQVPGFGYRAGSDDLSELLEEQTNTRRLFLAFAHSFLIQTSETAVANARASIEERLARWILMAQDRIGSDEIPLTHDFLAMMMAARRPGVTSAMQELERKGLVAGKRGLVNVLDRAGLLGQAGIFYGKPEAELKRLMKDVLAKAN